MDFEPQPVPMTLVPQQRRGMTRHPRRSQPGVQRLLSPRPSPAVTTGPSRDGQVVAFLAFPLDVAALLRAGTDEDGVSPPRCIPHARGGRAAGSPV